MSNTPFGQPTNQPTQPYPYQPYEQGQPPFPPQYAPVPAPKKSHKLRNGIIGGIAMLMLIGGCSAAMSGGGTGNVALTGPAPTTSSAPAKTKATEPAKTQPTKAVAPTMTKSQEQAVGTAKDYLDTSHFSKSGLITQLKFEEYSPADAKFAVTHIQVDWNEQAAGSAADYLDTSHFSRSGLIKQLEFEGYSQSQAEYGVENAGL